MLLLAAVLHPDTLIPAFFAITGAIIVITPVLASIRRQKARRTWVRTRGHLEKLRHSYGSFEVEYTYTVNGEPYRGGNLGVPLFRAIKGGTVQGASFMNRARAIQLRPGADVDVYFDPATPDDSALVVDDPGTKLLPQFIGLLMIGGSTLFWLRPELFAGHPPRLFALLFGVIAMVLLVFFVRLLRRHLQTATALTTTGCITKGEIHYERNSDKSSRGGYAAHIEFEYEVEGARYTSSQITALSVKTLKSQANAQRDLDGWLAQPEVTVLYLPGKPWDAFLRRGPAYGVAIPLIIALSFGTVGLFLFLKFS